MPDVTQIKWLNIYYADIPTQLDDRCSITWLTVPDRAYLFSPFLYWTRVKQGLLDLRGPQGHQEDQGMLASTDPKERKVIVARQDT